MTYNNNQEKLIKQLTDNQEKIVQDIEYGPQSALKYEVRALEFEQPQKRVKNPKRNKQLMPCLFIDEDDEDKDDDIYQFNLDKDFPEMN